MSKPASLQRIRVVSPCIVDVRCNGNRNGNINRNRNGNGNVRDNGNFNFNGFSNGNFRNQNFMESVRPGFQSQRCPTTTVQLTERNIKVDIPQDGVAQFSFSAPRDTTRISLTVSPSVCPSDSGLSAAVEPRFLCICLIFAF